MVKILFIVCLAPPTPHSAEGQDGIGVKGKYVHLCSGWRARGSWEDHVYDRHTYYGP